MRMSNPLYEQMMQNAMPNGMSQMFQQFQQFKTALNGNPKEMVMQMLQDGRISQVDLNQAQAFAQKFRGFLK